MPAPRSDLRSADDPIARARAFARWMDRLVGIPGSDLGIGLDAILGALIPVGGDVAGGVASFYVVAQAIRAKVPAIVIARMLLHIGLDALLGLIPVAGDLVDVFFQANLANLKLLEKHAGGRASTTGEWILVSLAVGFALAAVASPAIALFTIGWLLAR